MANQTSSGLGKYTFESIGHNYDQPEKDEPNAEVVVGSVGFQGGVYKTVAVGYDCGEVVLFDGALQHLLATCRLDLTSTFEDSLCISGKAALWEVYRVCWVRSDLECYWHDGQSGEVDGLRQGGRESFECATDVL